MGILTRPASNVTDFGGAASSSMLLSASFQTLKRLRAQEDNVNQSTASGTKWLGFGAVIVAGCVLVTLAAASAWQAKASQSDLDDAESHATTAALLQEAKGEGLTAFELLRQYVATGDETLLPEFKSHSAAGIDSLSTAVARGGVTDMSPLVAGGAQLVQGAGRIVATRQSGDAQGAVAALTDGAPQFQQFAAVQDQAIEAESAAAVSLRASADDADTAATWLAVGAGAIGVTMTLVAFALLGRRLFGRRVSKTASPA